MKNTSVLFCKVIFGVILCILVFSVSGCRYPVKAVAGVDDFTDDVGFHGEGEEFALQGETEAQRRRRWNRNERIWWQQIQEDFEKFWLMDRPSRLTDKRIP